MNIAGHTLTETLKPLRGRDWKRLMPLGGKGIDAKGMISMAFQEMAENAQKIGELNISPDLEDAGQWRMAVIAFPEKRCAARGLRRSANMKSIRRPCLSMAPNSYFHLTPTFT